MAPRKISKSASKNVKSAMHKRKEGTLQSTPFFPGVTNFAQLSWRSQKLTVLEQGVAT
jgi:hypothetical protein